MSELEDDMAEVIPKRLKLVMFKGFVALGWVLLTNAGRFKKLKEAGGNVKYVSPPRRYEIPEYKPGMRVCESNEKYLRPTPYCNYRVPEVIAMAHKLGAFQKSDYEYAKSAFEFVKRNIILEFLPTDDVVDTLRRGTGTCIHKISLFIALCRAAGIKARYKLYAPIASEAWYDHLVGADPLAQQWYNAMGYFLLHGEGEAFVDGKWVVADVGPTPERQAAQGIPISRFGEDSIGMWFYVVPGTVAKIESIDKLGTGLPRPLLRLAMEKLAKGSLARINLSVLKQVEQGRKILEELGEEEYDKKAREKHKPLMLRTELLERKPGLRFKGE